MINNSTFKEKEIEAEELTKVLCTLPREERLKIFYMIKGYELLAKPSSMNKQCAN